MRVEFVFPGKTKESYINAGIKDFSKRLSHFVRTDFKIIKDKPASKNKGSLLEKEGEGLLSGCSKSSYIIALAPEGKQCTSEEFADMVVDWENQGRQVISFIIGGPDGLSRQVLNAADNVLSLSKMTFTHEMARLLLLEQLYRAYNIKNGTKYHK